MLAVWVKRCCCCCCCCCCRWVWFHSPFPPGMSLINSGLPTSARLPLHGKSSQDGCQDLSRICIRKRQDRIDSFMFDKKSFRFVLILWFSMVLQNSSYPRSIGLIVMSHFVRCSALNPMKWTHTHAHFTSNRFRWASTVIISLGIGFLILFCFGWLFLRSMFSMIRRHPVCKCLAPSYTSMETFFAVIQCEWADEQTG